MKYINEIYKVSVFNDIWLVPVTQPTFYFFNCIVKFAFKNPQLERKCQAFVEIFISEKLNFAVNSCKEFVSL